MQSAVIQDCFSINIVNLSLSENINDIGKFSAQKIFLTLQLVKKGVRLIGATKPDLILYNCAPTGFAFYRDILLILIIRLISRAPIAYHIHGKGFKANADSSRLYRWLAGFLFKNSYAICLSKGLIKDVQQFNLAHTYTLNNGIPFTDRSDSDSIKSRPFTFLFLSNLTKSKGILEFIDSLAILKQKSTHQFAFSIIGKEFDVTYKELLLRIKNKNLEKELLNISAKFGIEKEHWLAERSDVLVLPTQNDCYPLVILEAFRAGLPVISSYEGAIPEMLEEGSTGFLVESADLESISDRMQTLLENPSLLKEMKHNTRQQYEKRFTQSLFDQNFILIIKDIIHRHAGISRG